MGVPLLIIMNIIAVLLCFLVNQAKSESDNIFPAKILARQKIISENSNLYLTCSTFGLKKSKKVFVYLCKDDSGMIKQKQKSDQNDSIFIIKTVSAENSGNYSCVYSVTDYSPSDVTSRGLNTIQILVLASFLPADISIPGPSTVNEGDDVKLTCTFSNALQTLGECGLIHSYLMKNNTILRVQAFNVKRMEATFTVTGAVMRDSGHYSCVVLPSKCIREEEETLSGNNSVFLEVKENMSPPLFGSLIIITMMLCTGLCFWVISKRGSSVMRCPCPQSEQTNADQLEEQQEHNEEEEHDEEEEPDQEEDVEAQCDDSFSEQEEDCGSSVYQNGSVADNVSGSKECEVVYDIVDDSAAQPVERLLYATSMNRGKRKN